MRFCAGCGYEVINPDLHICARRIEVTKATEELIAERHKTHGDFADNARISQKLKQLFADEISYGKMTVVQHEALDMIALKLSRILSGQANVADHWDDIAGYAKLASKEITG